MQSKSGAKLKKFRRGLAEMSSRSHVSRHRNVYIIPPHLAFSVSIFHEWQSFLVLLSSSVYGENDSGHQPCLWRTPEVKAPQTVSVAGGAV